MRASNLIEAARRWPIACAPTILVVLVAMVLLGPATTPTPTTNRSSGGGASSSSMVAAMALAELPESQEKPLYEKIVYHYENLIEAVKGTPELQELIVNSFKEFKEKTSANKEEEKEKGKGKIDKKVLKAHKFRLLAMRNMIENQLGPMLTSDESMRLSSSTSSSSSDDEQDDADSG